MSQPNHPAPHSREARLDALKGYAIICVVAFHALGQYFSYSPETGVIYDIWAVYARAFLFSYMLPLFAFLSGYVLGRPGGFRPKQYFTRRTFGLLVPYAVWELIYGPSKHPEMLNGLREFATYFMRIFQNPHYEGRMWYLLLLWIGLMIIGVVRLAGDRTWFIVLSVPVVYWAATQTPYWWLRWLYIFVAAGVLYRRYEDRILPILGRLGLVAGIAFVPLWLAVLPEPIARARFAAATADPLLLNLGSIALQYGPIVVGACAVVAIIAASYHVPEWLESPLAFLGQLSLGVYITHFPFVEMWNDTGLVFGPLSIHLWNKLPGWFLVVSVALATAIAMALTLIIGRFRPTAAVLLGEIWVKKPRQLCDVQTETL